MVTVANAMNLRKDDKVINAENLTICTGMQNPFNLSSTDRRFAVIDKAPVYLDLETTGLNIRSDEILEIAIVQADGVVLLDNFVNPTHVSQWPEAQAINGISPAMVENAPSLSDISEEIIDALADRTVYIWNASFDTGFMPFALDHAKDVVCAMREYGAYIEQTQPQNISKTGRYKLEYTAKDLGIEIDGDQHRALTDVITMMKVRQAYRADGFDRTDLSGSINVEAYKC